jgi:hypothetical protein
MTEEELLFKYRHGRTIDKEGMDEVLQLLYCYKMHSGFYIDKECEIIPTAKTTKHGKFFLSINTTFFTRMKWFFKYLIK